LPDAVELWITDQGGATERYGDINTWDVSEVTNMRSLFNKDNTSLEFNTKISAWDVSKVTDMEDMFRDQDTFDQDISAWNVSSVTTMSDMFYGASAFNQDISGWNVSKVTDMQYLFYLNAAFNQDISGWDVSRVTDMTFMFYKASKFNQNISEWDVSRVTTMPEMFFGASAFNQDISGWDVSKVTNMQNMFREASAFNQDISGWDVSKVTTVSFMFFRASDFKQDLCAWGSKLNVTVSTNGMFLSTDCPTEDDPSLSSDETTPPGPFCYSCAEPSSPVPSGIPSSVPSSSPSGTPSVKPSAVPSSVPSGTPTSKPSLEEKTAAPGDGSVQGDPHFKTWRGQRYDFHGECDLVLLQSKGFESGLDLYVHIRTQMLREMSYISSAVLRIGSDVLEVESQGVYYLNGVANAELPSEFSGFEFLHTKPTDKQHVFEVHLGGRERVKLKTYKDFVSVLIEQGLSKHFGDSVGLMGDFGKGRKFARDGKTVLDDANAFGQEWQVLDTDPTLFQTVRFPQHPQKCTMPTPKTTDMLRRRLLETSSVDELAAEKACEHWGEQGKDDCVFDVLTTGDLEMAMVGAY
jgi:surface protein